MAITSSGGLSVSYVNQAMKTNVMFSQTMISMPWPSVAGSNHASVIQKLITMGSGAASLTVTLRLTESSAPSLSVAVRPTV